MACGYNCAEAMQRASWLADQPGFQDLPAVQQNRVFAVDAGYFSRPGPRVVEGAELLAHLLHPDRCSWNGPEDAFHRFQLSNLRVEGYQDQFS
jgi:iron complex transport system substrate-binding protein